MVLGVVFALSASGNRARESSTSAANVLPVIEITDIRQIDETVSSGDSVLVGFASAGAGGDFAGLHERFREAARQVRAAGVAEGAQFLLVDVDTLEEAASKYGVDELPQVVLYRDGERVLRKTGLDASSVYAASMVSSGGGDTP